MTDVGLRPLAESDLVERSEYYRSEGGDSLGERFFDAAIEALGDIERMPGACSPRTVERMTRNSPGDVPMAAVSPRARPRKEVRCLKRFVVREFDRALRADLATFTNRT